MSNNKYSHALVMSQFQDSGLLNMQDRTRSKPRSSAVNPNRISWTIAEVLPPSKPQRSKSPDRVMEIRSRSTQEEIGTSSLAPTAVQMPEYSTSLNRSDSVVTKVYAPQVSKPSFEKQRARQSRNQRNASGLRASVIPDEGAWKPRLASLGMASPKSPRCTCGAVVQDPRLQSSYFPDSKTPQKPLPTLPGERPQTMVRYTEDMSIQEETSTPRFELAASSSPRLPPASETASIKPIRRMAPPRSPTATTPTSARSSTSWPKQMASNKTHLIIEDSPTSSSEAVSSPQPFSISCSDPMSARSSTSWPKPPTNTKTHLIIEDSPSSSPEAVSNPRPFSMSLSDPASRPLSSQTTPPTSPSLSSIFSFPSQKLSQGPPPSSDYDKIPIHDKDITHLPWGSDDPEMGPAVFCSSPPPGLNYLSRSPSPGSSIDDATPPPISRVRREHESKPTRRTSISAPRTSFPSKSRPRALSSPAVARPKTSHVPALPGPPVTLKTQRRHQHQQQQQQQQHDEGPRKRSPSLDIRREPASMSYTEMVPGSPPIPTTERIAPPPPLSGGLIRGSKEKEVEKLRWGRFRGMFGWWSGMGPGVVGVGYGGMKGNVDAIFMRGLVSGS